MTRNAIPARLPSRTVLPPLCVDLDGTLIKSDSLLDAVCQFGAAIPPILATGRWLAVARARLKAEVARRAPLDPAHCPTTPSCCAISTPSAPGRQIYLTTGADGPLAERVAEHLGIFEGVLASDGVTNLTSVLKLELLKDRFGEFDYIGNSRPICPCWSTRVRPWWPIPPLACASRCSRGTFRWHELSR